MKNNKQLIELLVLILILLITLLISCIYYENFFIKDDNNVNNSNQETNIEEKEEVPKEYTTNMIMVGDALIHSSVYKDAKRLANNKGYNFKPQIEYIKKIVSDYDIAYYNQETILGGTELGLSDYPRFNSPQEVGDAMIDAGFNLVSLATNHTIDAGEKGVLSSRKYWNSKSNVHAVGSYSSDEEKLELESKILESNNIKYAMLNYTYGTNGLIIPDGKKYLVNEWNDINNFEGYKEFVKKDIENIRDKVDILIVAMHWGREYTHEPTVMERKMAEYLASLDVDIIIGTHPHVIQPIEWIDDTLVFYSLGNFVSAQYQDSGSCSDYKCMVGLMSSLTITKTEYNGETTIKIDNIKNDLIYTYYSNWRNFKVIPFSNPKIKDYLKNYKIIYDKYSKIIESDDERIKIVALGIQ